MTDRDTSREGSEPGGTEEVVAPVEAATSSAVEAATSSTAVAESVAAANDAVPATADGSAPAAEAGSAPAADNSVPAADSSAPAASEPVRAADEDPTPAVAEEPVPATAPREVAQKAHPLPGAPSPSAPAVAEASADPSRWGRVDADGTVYVRTADGERAVGSWQAGAPEEGLAHYARRFDDIRTEVELLEARLAAGSGDPKHSLTSAKHIKESLTDAAVVGDLVGLAARLDHVLSRAEGAVAGARHARDEARAKAVARKQELVAEAEKIAEEATQWKSAGDRLRAVLDEWKTIKGVDRKTDDQLWKRFSKADRKSVV